MLQHMAVQNRNHKEITDGIPKKGTVPAYTRQPPKEPQQKRATLQDGKSRKRDRPGRKIPQRGPSQIQIIFNVLQRTTKIKSK